MMSSITGRVVEKNAEGFVLAGNDGCRIQVLTVRHGEEITIAIGDNLVVFGGPSTAREGFASSTAYKLVPDGREISVELT